MKNILLLPFLVGWCSAYCPTKPTPSWTTRPTPSWTTRPTSGPPQNNSCSLDYDEPCRRFIRQSKSDNFDWTLHSGPTLSVDTGPSRDHTTGYGKYYYTEASYPRKTGDRARLIIHVKTNYPACFYFHYHMYGDSMGALRFYIDYKKVWELSGNQGNQWIKGTFPVKYPGHHVIYIDGIRGSSFTSDMAIDDLGYQEFRYMSNSDCMLTPSCANPYHRPTPPTTYPTWRPTTYPTWRPSTYPTWRPTTYPTWRPSTYPTWRPSTYPTWRPTAYPTWRPTSWTPNPPHVVCGRPSVASSRVIGGHNAAPGAWPWQVGLYAWGKQFMCGGSLIAPQFVVTAAHCIFDGARYEVVLGDNIRDRNEGTEERIPAYKVKVHRNWNSSTIDSDIAVIKLDRPARINTYVQPVCLPSYSDHVWHGKECYITGWGKIKHPGSATNILQQARLPVVGNYECQAKLSANSSSSSSGSPGLTITDNMICGGEKGSIKSGCHGDSGGPYVCRGWNGQWVLQGVVSWGSPRCDAHHRYTVFARVAKFRSWINHQLQYL